MNSSNNSPKLSIVVPIYNVEEFLEECMESINVSISDIDAEVLLIDDGATDSSSEIAKGYADEHDGFVYYRKENGGLSDARNYGAARATGKYLAFVDSDDLVEPDMYKNLLETAEYHQADLTICDVIRCNSRRTWASGLHKRVFYDMPDTVTHISKCENLFYDTTAWNKLIRKDFWDKNGFQYPVGWRFEDMPVSLAMHHKANKVAIVQRVGYLWRVRDKDTKSITQENTNSINLVHRLQMLDDMFDYIRDEMDNDSKILEQFRYKTLSLDLIIFINEMTNISKELAEEYIRLINEFLDKHYAEEDINKQSVLIQQKFEYVRKGSVKNILDIIDYENKRYRKAPYYMGEDGELKIKLPSRPFSIKDRSASKDILPVSAKEYVRSFDISDSVLSIDGYIYFAKISMSKNEDQKVKAYLVNFVTGEQYAAEVYPRTETKLTTTRGFVYDRTDDSHSNYCFDGTGFTIKMDFNKYTEEGIKPGNYYIRLDYENFIRSGSLVMHNWNTEEKQYSRDRHLLFDNRIATIDYDRRSTIVVNVEDRDSDINYYIKQTEDGLTYLDKDLAEKTRTEDVIAYVDELSKNGAKTNVNTTVIGKLAEYDKLTCNLIYQDEATGKYELLAAGNTQKAGDAYKASFEVDFSDVAISDKLHDGKRRLYIAIEELASDCRIPITIKTNERVMITDEEIGTTVNIEVLADDDNFLVIKSTGDWEDEDIGIDKRNYNLYHCYPLFQKEPINEKCIVFESLWGQKYNCNPAALYEYIIDNHPGYECVWFLNDIRTPIKGDAKIVKRGSREYYYYLATAKYIVENTNLPDDYIKRPEQVEIQTMHGTPFKSFGLDIPQDFNTPKKRQLFVQRNSRWNYLIAQGVFTQKMAWRWFRYKRDILKTGYPRTDSIFKKDETATRILKSAFGIPTDKKIILYAPTWRDKKSFEMMLDLQKMKEALADEYILMVRVHYFNIGQYEAPYDDNFVFDLSKANKIEDLYPVADILITDYSSVMFDYALTDKPMIFYAYDLDEYTKETRGAYFDITKDAPGTLALTTEDVIDAIKSIDTHYDRNKKRIDRFKRKYLTYENPNSCEEVYNHVFEKGIVSKRTKIINSAAVITRAIVPKKLYRKARRKIYRTITKR